jgi:hypothetical protein
MYSSLAQLAYRKTAFALALVCLWLCSGTALDHTDDLSALLGYSRAHRHSQGILRRQTPTPPADVCAACQWEQVMPTLRAQTVGFERPLSLLTIVIASLPKCLHLRPFDYTGTRAPPFLLR